MFLDLDFLIDFDYFFYLHKPDDNQMQMKSVLVI